MNGLDLDKIPYESFLFREVHETVRKVEVEGKDGKKKTVMMPETITIENMIEKDIEKIKAGFKEFQKFIESGPEIIEQYGKWSIKYKGKDGKIYFRYIMGFVADGEGIRLCGVIEKP